MTDAINTQALSQIRGNRFALRDINLNIGWGHALSIVGPNGSGKTTLIKLLGSLITPTDGKIFIAGMDTSKKEEAIHRIVGFVSHELCLYNSLTIEENLLFYEKLFGLTNSESKRKTLLDSLGLLNHSSTRVEFLSHGMRKRAAIAKALLPGPWILFLDEPETGLDQEAFGLLKQVVTSHCSDGGTVVMASHNFDSVLQMSDSIAILSVGKLAHYGPCDGLTKEGLLQAYSEEPNLLK
jgi:heme ABC exporter ATP-binding subunit CcmA